ncbi:MAG: hypothetical protein HOJ87_05890 [Rhodospirillaceae bacterium]|nr:hypothetical protein [Rhodospirillaceae bacterium]MBT5561865.1 hypothetical protein [Rhodospirillaceae bacterium]
MNNIAQNAEQSPPMNGEAKVEISTSDFLHLIFSELEDDEHICVSRATPKKDGTGVWFKNHLLTARQWRKWEPGKQAQAWYFCVSSINGGQNDKGTMVGRGRKNLKRYHCLVLDDIGTKGKPPPIEPSWKITTSIADGIQNQQWGYMLDPGDDWGRYEALVEWCAAQGWSDGGAGGSYRLMRVPGSANMKPGRQEYRSVITDWVDGVWSLDELADDLGCDFTKVEIGDNVVTFKHGGAAAMNGIDPLLDWLTDNGSVVRDDGGQWVDIVCPWADAHTTGENTAGYSPLGRGTCDYVQTRAFKCLHEHCVKKKLPEFREWVNSLDGPHFNGYDPLPWLQSRYAYISTGQMVADLHQRPDGGIWQWTLADWTKDHPGRISVPGHDKPVTLATAFVEHQRTKKAVSLMYQPVAPDRDTGIVEAFNQSYVNTYVPPNWEETDRNPSVFIEHMEYLIPSNVQREIFLNWLAYKIQHPMSRSYAVVMVAEDAYGTGRSWVKKMISKALQGHVNSASLGQLIGRGEGGTQTYTDWQTGCQFLIVEEAKDSSLTKDDFYHGYETFKQMVDTSVDETVRVNPKYERTRTESRYFNALIFTNHADAIALPENCRRTYVIENPTERQDYDYYDRLAGSLQTKEPARVYWWLMNRDVSDYDHIYPPMTAAKLRMIEDTRAPSDAIIEWIKANHAPDLVTKKSLKTAIVAAAHKLDLGNQLREPGGISRILWRKFKTLRPDDPKHGARYMIGDDRVEVRAIRNVEKWLSVDRDRDNVAVEAEIAKAEIVKIPGA